MKKILLIITAVAFATFSFSQQLSRYVVASGGNYSTASGISVSSTIGEPMVTTLTAGSNILTQGFQQSFSAPVDPTIVITNPLEGDNLTTDITAYVEFTVSDFIVGSGTGDGHIHYYVNGALTMKYDTSTVVLSNLSNGNYVVIMRLVDNSHQPFTPNIADTVSFSVNVVYGCTGPTSCNYDPNATIDDGSCYGAMGCTDPSACNYNTAVCIDDGSCEYTSCATCNGDPITGLFVTDIIDDRVVANFDNMNTYDANGTQVCRVDQIRIRYREVGTSSWSQKNIASPTGYDATTGICNSTQKTDKNMYNLTLGTTYEWEVKTWYCDAVATGWVVGPNFTTAGECPNVGNLTAVGTNPNKATFTWDDSNGSYEFVRIKVRVDSISSPVLSDWFNVGGNGVTYPTFTKDKNSLVAGETYRGQARTWCNPNGGAYNSLAWTSLVTWTQPAATRVEGGNSIDNLDVYPNPSRDIFNVSFTSEDVQEIEVRVLNVIGEVVYTENLDQFVGEYTKAIDLATYTKGIYFLEISTNDGVINKKLILQ